MYHVNLDDKLATRYHQMIGILVWLIELGRINIIPEISHLSSSNCLLRKGHLEAAYQVFEYLINHKTYGRIVYDATTPTIDPKSYIKVNWKEVYVNLKEHVLDNRPGEQ